MKEYTLDAEKKLHQAREALKMANKEGGPQRSREVSLAITNIEQAILWLNAEKHL